MTECLFSVTKKTTAYLTVSFYDKAGALQIPATATYRIDDVGSGDQVRDTTNLTPATEIEIILRPSDNVILRGGNEKRRVTVTATYGVDDQVVDEYVYGVVDLRKVT
jgi:hypothetical protein